MWADLEYPAGFRSRLEKMKRGFQSNQGGNSNTEQYSTQRKTALGLEGLKAVCHKGKIWRKKSEDYCTGRMNQPMIL